MIFLKYFSGLICVAYLVSAQETNNLSQSTFRHVRRVYKECENSDDFYKCLKVNAVKLADRAMKIQNLKLIDGISVIRKDGVEESRSFNDNKINDLELSKISSKNIDHLLSDRSNRFMDTHQIEINVPRLFSMGQKQGDVIVEEGRKKMNKFLGPFLAAVAIKGGILTMAYHSIAIVAGKALIIGKIALIISAIIGLKKLVTPEGHEKTTYEIVKHPHVQQSHTYSTSHNEFEGHDGGGGGGGGQYHRSLNDEMMMQDRAYRGHMKASV